MAGKKKIEIASSRLSGEGGFTLIEMLVSMVILCVVMAGVFSFLWGASSYWQTGQDVTEITENARIGLNRMTREVRQSYQVTGASSSQVSFGVDFGDGPQTVTYGFTPGEGGATGYVWRDSSGGMQATLIDNVESVQFVYYGNDYRCDLNADGLVTYSELATCGVDLLKEIARVDIILTLRMGNDSAQTFMGQAWLRNRSVV